MSREGVLLDTAAIRRTIPQRAPFLLVDRILNLVPNERILGARDVSAEDPWLAGHFPGYPVMPGVLVVEALAQTAAAVKCCVNESQRWKHSLRRRRHVRSRICCNCQSSASS